MLWSFAKSKLLCWSLLVALARIYATCIDMFGSDEGKFSEPMMPSVGFSSYVFTFKSSWPWASP